MTNYPHPIIAREGWPFIAVIGLLAIGLTLWLSFWIALPVWVIWVFVVQFFRDPPRTVPANPNAIVSPADGRILAVHEVEDPYTQKRALKISVFMNVFNVHSNRSPVDGKIDKIQYYSGKFFNADFDKASLENERNVLVIQASNGKTLTCVQVAGLVARRILCYVKPGDALAKGQRYGFIRFGSRVDLFLPTDSIPKVAIGDKVYATETVLAEW